MEESRVRLGYADIQMRGKAELNIKNWMSTPHLGEY